MYLYELHLHLTNSATWLFEARYPRFHLTRAMMSFRRFAVRTGLEPVKYGEFIRCTHTFNITTQASNQFRHLTIYPTSPVDWTGCHAGVGVSRYFGTPWNELESNQWHVGLQPTALPTELPFQMWGREVLCVVVFKVCPLLFLIPFSQEQHNKVDNDGVPVSLQS